jgi:RNA polymerase sigma-70 factor (ECF subfamily)
MPVKLDASALVARHQVEIWRYLRFLGCDPHQAEDLAQDTFLSVLRNPFADRGRAASASYLRRVARNLLLKSKRGTGSGAEFDEMEASWQRYRGEDGGNTYVEALDACVQGLEGKGRQVMQLIYQQGCSLQAAAAALGLRVNGVRTLLQRVRQGLRSCVTRRMRS